MRETSEQRYPQSTSVPKSFDNLSYIKENVNVGHSLVDCVEDGAPAELVTLIRWILQGAKATTSESRSDELHKLCVTLSHSIVQACKTDRQVKLTPVSLESAFYTKCETPYSVGLSLWMYYHF